MLVSVIIFPILLLQPWFSKAAPSGDCRMGCPVVVPQTCPGVIERVGECGCSACITKLKGPGESCGERLGADGVCDSVNGLTCIYPLDDPYANGICEKGMAPQVLIAPPPQKESFLGKIGRFFG